jgi:hypothetical protein
MGWLCMQTTPNACTKYWKGVGCREFDMGRVPSGGWAPDSHAVLCRADARCLGVGVMCEAWARLFSHSGCLGVGVMCERGRHCSATLQCAVRQLGQDGCRGVRCGCR